MNGLACGRQRMNSDFAKERRLKTTLYDLIEAISEEAGPDKEGLISAAIFDLIQSGKLKWARRHSKTRSDINFYS